MRVALVHDWLDTWGGGEIVLAELRRVFPGAEIFTLVDFLDDDRRARLGAGPIHVSVLQALPFAHRVFRYAALLWPSVIRRFDLSGFNVIVSDSHAVAKGARRRDGQVHVCYCHSPARYAWTIADVYLDRAASGSRWKRALARRVLNRFRDWDLRSTPGVDAFLANSGHIAAEIERCYGRKAQVIYPPVDGTRFAAIRAPRSDHFVTVSRLVPYKRIDVIVDAFRLLPSHRLIVVGDGPERARLATGCPANVEFAGAQDDDATARIVATARAFVLAAVEDFGIAPVEAQAAGTPVIALARGGACETIRGLDDPSPTGVLFDGETPEALAAAVRLFDSAASRIDAEACRRNAARFAPERFRAEIARAVAAAVSGSHGGAARVEAA